MNSKTKQFLFLLVLVVILFAVNYPFLDRMLERNFLSPEYVFIERVIDGDTVVANGTSIRMLGINTPEKGEMYYSEAKAFLENLVLNKSVRIERHGKDLYKRDLAFLFIDDENLNVKIVENGFANVYILDNKIYETQLREAWENCVNKNINFCKKSDDKCANCISLKELDYKKDIAVFENVCDFDCNLNGWSIKDEGRKKFVFDSVLKSDESVEVTADDFGQEYVWTDTGDTLFLRDKDGGLVLWESY